MTDSRGCEHEGTKVETASNRLNGVADPEGATLLGYGTVFRLTVKTPSNIQAIDAIDLSDDLRVSVSIPLLL